MEQSFEKKADWDRKSVELAAQLTARLPVAFGLFISCRGTLW
jgi:hypothetical protein